MSKKITPESIESFARHLAESEKSSATIQKYRHEATELARFMEGQDLTKSMLLAYKEQLVHTCKAATVNMKLSAINAFLRFFGLPHYRMKFLKIQRDLFRAEERELTEAEYRRLLNAARRRNDRLYHIMQTICGTGIRVSELSFITVEAVKEGYTEIRLKGKTRKIILTPELRKLLRAYIAKNSIESGCVFRTRTGRPLDRSNILHEMKHLCSEAHVDPHKVFPHNLRRLFARCFYAVEKNLAYLADVLGHSSIETTRIYVATSLHNHIKVLRKIRLLA